MKNQYFGDINDYRKYGLLRALTNRGEIKTAVCWMLTPDDGRGDGSRIQYLSQPDDWCPYDSDLFCHLEKAVLHREVRNVAEIENSDILPSCVFLSDVVQDDEEGREAYFQRLTELARGCDLIFFDPDNGIEVESKPYGRQDSSKYLYWHEIKRFWDARHSLLIYQHFPHVKQEPYIEGKVRELVRKTRAPEVFSFRTSHVVFFLLPQRNRLYCFRERSEEVARRWDGQIRVAYHIA